MSRLVFTSIKDIDNLIIEELDIKSFIAICKTNKEAIKYCNNHQLWKIKFNNENINIDPTFHPKNFNDWVNYYNFYDYVHYMNLERRPINWDIEFKKLNKAIAFKNDILMIQETDDDLNYRHIYIDIKNPSLYQPIYRAMKYNSYDNFDFNDIHDQYNEFRFKYMENEYWLFFNVDAVTFDEYPDELEIENIANNPLQFRTKLTKEEFHLMLTLIIYADNYSNIFDHNGRSFIQDFLNDDEHDLKRIGMLNILNYLHKNNLI